MNFFTNEEIWILSEEVFELKGDVLEIFPSHHEDRSWKISFFGDDIEKISEIDPLTGENLGDLEQIRIFANSHYVTP